MKLNAEDLAAKRWGSALDVPSDVGLRTGYRVCITEVAQPLQDRVEELEAALMALVEWNKRNPMGHGSIEGDIELEVVIDDARAILVKHA